MFKCLLFTGCRAISSEPIYLSRVNFLNDLGGWRNYKHPGLCYIFREKLMSATLYHIYFFSILNYIVYMIFLGFELPTKLLKFFILGWVVQHLHNGSVYCWEEKAGWLFLASNVLLDGFYVIVYVSVQIKPSYKRACNVNLVLCPTSVGICVFKHILCV